jgi:hypothetical protein
MARVTIDCFLYLGNSRIVVNFRINAYPQLGKVGTIHFIGHFRSANVRSEIQYSVNGAEFLAGSNRNPVHRFNADAGFLNPVHQEVCLFEFGHEFFTQFWNGNQGGDERNRD